MSFDVAMSLADVLHKGQTRKGMPFPFIVHPVDVVRRLMLWGIDDDTTLSAGILHDVREDSNITYTQLVEIVGKKIADIVEELTFTGATSKDAYMRSFSHKSLFALIIKLSDRFSNVSDYRIDNPKYALRYFHKADALIAAGLARLDHLNEFFGPDVGTKAMADLENLQKQLGKGLTI